MGAGGGLGQSQDAVYRRAGRAFKWGGGGVDTALSLDPPSKNKGSIDSPPKS